MVEKNIMAYFEKINIEEYNNRGMNWILTPGHYWIELQLNKGAGGFDDIVFREVEEVKKDNPLDESLFGSEGEMGTERDDDVHEKS